MYATEDNTQTFIVTISLLLGFLFVMIYGDRIGQWVMEEIRAFFQSVRDTISWCRRSIKNAFNWLYDRPFIYCSFVFAIGLWAGKGYFEFFTMLIESAKEVAK